MIRATYFVSLDAFVTQCLEYMVHIEIYAPLSPMQEMARIVK